MEDKEIIENYRKDQTKVMDSLRRTEGLLIVLLKTIQAMPHDEFWLMNGHRHIKEGVLSVIASISEINEEKVLKHVREHGNMGKREQEGNETNKTDANEEKEEQKETQDSE